jgi:hypothetical protein
MAMPYSREWLTETLRRLGYDQEADEAATALPEEFDLEQLLKFSNQHGISRGDLEDRMGGSP